MLAAEELDDPFGSVTGYSRYAVDDVIIMIHHTDGQPGLHGDAEGAQARPPN